MKKNIYIVLGDFRERDDNQDISYIGFSHEKAIDTWLEYLRKKNSGKDDHFKTRNEFDEKLIKLGKMGMYKRYNHWGFHSCATLITKRVEV